MNYGKNFLVGSNLAFVGLGLLAVAVNADPMKVNAGLLLVLLGVASGFFHYYENREANVHVGLWQTADEVLMYVCLASVVLLYLPVPAGVDVTILIALAVASVVWWSWLDSHLVVPGLCLILAFAALPQLTGAQAAAVIVSGLVAVAFWITANNWRSLYWLFHGLWHFPCVVALYLLILWA